MTLSNQREKFAQECAAGRSQREAYLSAYPKAVKWKEGVAASRASDLARLPPVRARINELRAKVVDEFIITQAQAKEAVLRDAWEVLNGDAADLITHRRLNCRHCHGTGHAYRWRDEAEFWGALATASLAQDSWDQTPEDRRRGKRPELPTDEGGYGFRRLQPPSARCPECEGEGHSDVTLADVRTLTGASRRLYSGVKVKKDGSVEMLMRNKEAARELLGRYAGVVVDKVLHAGTVGLVPMVLTDAEKAKVLKALESDI